MSPRRLGARTKPLSFRPKEAKGETPPPAAPSLLRPTALGARLPGLNLSVQLLNDFALAVPVFLTFLAVVNSGERNVGLNKCGRIFDQRLQPGLRLLEPAFSQIDVRELIA